MYGLAEYGSIQYCNELYSVAYVQTKYMEIASFPGPAQFIACGESLGMRLHGETLVGADTISPFIQ